MKYRAFFHLEINHPYFTANGAADLAILPDKQSLHYLKGRSFIVKDTQKGLTVLIPVDENGTAKPVFQADQVLTFEVYPRSGAFSSFTETSGLNTGEIFRFSNDGLPAGTSELVSSASLEKGSLNGFPMVAKVEILLTETLFTDADSTPYTITFQAKSAKWKYYFVSGKDTTDLSVEDRDENLVFNPIQLDEQSQDTIGLALQSNFPDSNLFLFESNTSIAYSDQAVKNLQLLRDGHVIIKHLPNPEIEKAAIKIIKI